MIFPLLKAKYNLLYHLYQQREIGISRLLREARLSPRVGYAYLKDLIKAGIVSETKTGEKPSVRMIRPNFSSESGQLFFALLEEEKKNEFLEKYPSLYGPLHQFNEETKRFILTGAIFGSFARQSANQSSDLDLLIVTEKRNKKKLSAIIERCFITISSRVSARILEEVEFVQLIKKKNPFALQIANEHIIVVNGYNWVKLLNRVYQE
ncbi:MAG TPA: nucleotidyltransferase domain-containing protein [Candidatus Nanoarchaeia archaeon]|nr:nucleotidyltransferase domain-containing protein [Candidatus Nanoarchaeia archaeon]